MYLITCALRRRLFKRGETYSTTHLMRRYDGESWTPTSVCRRYSRVRVLVSGSIPSVDVNEEDGHGAKYDKRRGEVVTSLVAIPNVDVTCRENVLVILQVNI